MRNPWLLAQMRPPGRHLYADFTTDTWNGLPEGFLSEDNCLMKMGRAGNGHIVWRMCFRSGHKL